MIAKHYIILKIYLTLMIESWTNHLMYMFVHAHSLLYRRNLTVAVLADSRRNVYMKCWKCLSWFWRHISHSLYEVVNTCCSSSPLINVIFSRILFSNSCIVCGLFIYTLSLRWPMSKNHMDFDLFNSEPVSCNFLMSCWIVNYVALKNLEIVS